ncbi:MAG: BMP family ABC transporter substrate-binding protein [Christensenellales bacterium]
MKKFLALLLVVVMCIGCFGVLTACNNSEIKVGLICLHDENSTYDNNFIQAFKAACEAKGLSEDEYAIVTGIPEGTECYNEAVNLAEKGAKAIFADSFGHESYMLQAAQEYTDVTFCHATGTKAHTENLPNFYNAFASIYEGRYLAGVAAGMKLVELYGDSNDVVSDTNAVIGYVGAFPYAEVVSGYTSFFLGVKSIVPNVTMKVQYTSSWYDQAAENTAAVALIQAGCKLISQHADSMGAPNACESAGIPNVSYNGSTAASCPNTFIISSKINWQPYFEMMIDNALNGTAITQDYVGTIATGSVQLTELGTAAAAGTAAKLEEVKAQLANGTLKVFDTAKFTVNGGDTLTSYLADVDDFGDYVGETEVIKTVGGITYFAESEYRSAPYFDVRIDGITELNN